MNALKGLIQNKIRNCYLCNRLYSVAKLTFDDDSLPIFQYASGKRSDRRLYAWGLAETGALGLHQPRTAKKKKHKRSFSYTWHPMRTSFAERFDVIDIACGFGFTLAAVKSKDQYKVFGTGINTDSQIGYHAPRVGHPLELVLNYAPVFLPFKSLETEVIGVSAGRAHSLILTDNEGVFTIGNNAYGQCGRTINPKEEYRGSTAVHHIKNFANEKIVNVNCGEDHSLFLTDGGRVWACGWGADGQTGLGTYENQSIPAQVRGDIKYEKIVKVTSTADCVLALNDKGELFGWGNSEYGQVPMTEANKQVDTAYALVSFTKGIGKIIDVAAGGSHCLIVNDAGDVFVWGYGLLGLGPRVEHVAKPTVIPPTLFGQNKFNPDTTVIKVASGVSHLAAVTNDGNLYMWGRNRYGCLGLGHDKDQHFPLKVSIGAHVLDVSCSLDHSVAVCKPFS